MIKNIDGRNFMYNDSTAGTLKYSCKHSDVIFLHHLIIKALCSTL